MQPRQRRVTLSPVLPNFVYCILMLLEWQDPRRPPSLGFIPRIDVGPQPRPWASRACAPCRVCPWVERQPHARARIPSEPRLYTHVLRILYDLDRARRRVDHIQRPRRRDRHTVLRRRRPHGRGVGREQGTGRAELLDPPVAAVENEDVSGGVDSDIPRSFEL